ncbi:MAG TPA: FtsX-like permease family protein [Lacipirellulaceae bacterium]|jgi:putative ABC transport system permease protein
MVYSKLAWREIRKRPGRAILTLLSIVIGVAAVVAVSISAGTASRAFDEIYQTIAGKATLEIAPPIGKAFDQSIADSIRDVPGVKEVAPLIQRQVMVYIGDKSVRIIAMGVDPVRDHAVHDYEITAGQSLEENPKGVILDATFAKSLDLNPGDKMEVQTPKGIRPAPIIGLYQSKGTATTGQGAVLLMPISAAQILFKCPKKIYSAQIVLQPDADEASVSAAIAKQLPKGIEVRRPAARSPMAEETSLSTEQGMRMARVFSLLVALFIIINTFLINVTQRRRQLGIMRAIGATRGQIASMIYTEAIMMGLAGTVLGSVLGITGAQFLNIGMGALYKTILPPIELTPTPFLLAILFGMGISLLAAALPARKASHMSPLEAMRDVTHEEIAGVSRWFVLTGLTIVIVCGGVLAATIDGLLPMMIAVWAGVVLLIGIVLMLPIVLKQLSNWVSVLLRPFVRVEGRLARLQLLRHRSRTTLTVGVVFIAVSTGIGLASSVIDNVSNVQTWYHKAFTADFFVRAMAPSMASGLMADLPDTLGDDIKKIPGITSIDATRTVSAKAAGEQVILIAREYHDTKKPPMDIVSGDRDMVRERLIAGDTVIGSVLAERAGLKVGDEIPFETEDGTQQFRVAAIANDYLAGGLTMYLERDVARKVLGIEGVDGYIIQADHQKIMQVREALEKLCEENGILLNSFSDIQRSIDKMISGVVAALWALVVLGLLVAAFGVANTLSMNVLEQTREIGLLRILAMTRAQVRKTIFSQALMIALLALVPGIFAGVVIAYLISLATVHVIGHMVAFNIHPDLMAGSFVAGLIVIGAAAWFPADRAAKLNLQTALSFR